jgi:hypothetical protein
MRDQSDDGRYAPVRFFPLWSDSSGRVPEKRTDTKPFSPFFLFDVPYIIRGL